MRSLHLRCGVPRSKPVDEIPMGRYARNGNVWRYSFLHRCGAKLKTEGYGISPMIRCPTCGEIIHHHLPRCLCGLACCDAAALYVHSLDCPVCNDARHGTSAIVYSLIREA